MIIQIIQHRIVKKTEVAVKHSPKHSLQPSWVRRMTKGDVDGVYAIECQSFSAPYERGTNSYFSYQTFTQITLEYFMATVKAKNVHPYVAVIKNSNNQGS